MPTMTTEQELVNAVFPDDNTKTISDVIAQLKEIFIQSGETDITDNDIISSLKNDENHSNITDWSI
tara:strand:+ start:208 stop:405 length:198 start_codon:yes stop_codon:yes gene_type:complete